MINDVELIVRATGLTEEEVDKVLSIWLEVALLQIVFYGSYNTPFGTIKMEKSTGKLLIDRQNPVIQDIASNTYSKEEIINMITEQVVRFDHKQND
jgi:hypothetical protein